MAAVERAIRSRCEIAGILANQQGVLLRIGRSPQEEEEPFSGIKRRARSLRDLSEALVTCLLRQGLEAGCVGWGLA